MRRTALLPLVLLACLGGAAPASAAWRAPETVAANPLDDIRDAHAAGGAAGEIVATWETSGHRYLRIRAADGSWSAPTDLGGTYGTSALASDAAGNVLAAWTASNGDLLVIRRPAGGPTPAPTVVAHAGGGDVAAAIDGATAVVAYPGAGETVLRSEDAGATWTSASASPAGDDVAAAVRHGGEAVVTWTSSGRVRAAAWPDGGTLGAAMPVSSAVAWAAAPDLALDADGDALAAWAEAGSAYASPVRVASRPAGSAWSAPVAAGGTTLLSTGPQVAVTPGGHAFVTWQTIVDGEPVGSGYTSGADRIADGTVTPLALGTPAAFGIAGPAPVLGADGAGALAATGSAYSRGLRVLRVGPTGAAATDEHAVCPPAYTDPQSVMRVNGTSAVLWLQASILLDRHALELSTDTGTPGSMAGDCADHLPTVVQSPSPVPVGQPVHLQLVNGVDPDAARTEIFWDTDGDFVSIAGAGTPTGAVPSLDTSFATAGLIASTVAVDQENSFGRAKSTSIPFYVSVCAVCPSAGGGGGGGGGGSAAPGGSATPAPAAPAPPPSVTPPASTSSPATTAPLTLSVPSRPALASVRRDGLRVSIGAAHTTRVRLEVRLGGAVAGLQRLSVPAGTTKTITVMLDQAARRALRHRSMLVVRLVPAAGVGLATVERRVRVS